MGRRLDQSGALCWFNEQMSVADTPDGLSTQTAHPRAITSRPTTMKPLPVSLAGALVDFALLVAPVSIHVAILATLSNGRMVWELLVF